MSTTKIEWTEKSWNPIIGCSKVSDGCKNCYAETMTCRIYNMLNKVKQTPKENDTWLHFGKVIKFYGEDEKPYMFNGNVELLPDRLEQPLHWRKPCRIFVNSMSDLFHEKVPFEFIDKVFDIICKCPQHTFQILTKRPERMYDYWMNSTGTIGGVVNIPKNAQLGVSVENQDTADERIPILLQIPAAVRWISYEPALGGLSLRWLGNRKINDEIMNKTGELGEYDVAKKLDWVACGGESGPGARDIDLDWARKVRDDCKNAGVPFFMKQLCKNGRKIKFEDFPVDLQIRQYPN